MDWNYNRNSLREDVMRVNIDGAEERGHGTVCLLRAWNNNLISIEVMENTHTSNLEVQRAPQDHPRLLSLHHYSLDDREPSDIFSD